MTLWFNLGDWTKAVSFEEACQDLALRLAERAGLSDDAALNVLDVGVGSGVQDALFVERFGANVVGVEPGDVLEHNRRYGSERLRFVSGRGEALPVNESFDRVMALDCAYHFRHRSDFFREALRVLRPGGKLAAFDLAMTRPVTLKDRALARLAGVPHANLWHSQDVGSRLEQAGFAVEAIEDMSSSVWPGLLRYAEMHPYAQNLSPMLSLIHI